MSRTAGDARRIVMPDVLDVDDLAFWLRCTPAFARSLLRSGAIPGRHLGRRWLVTRSALLRVLESEHVSNEQGAPVLSVVRGTENCP
jgi:hypothetical protein